MENLPPEVSLHSKYCALGMHNEGHSNNGQDPGNPNHSIPSLVWETVALEKDVIFGDSLLWAAKAFICHPDFSPEKFTAYQHIAFTMSLQGCWAYWTLQITICYNTILYRVCGKTALNTLKRLYIPQSNIKSLGACPTFSSVLPGRHRSSGKRSQIERWMPGCKADAILKVWLPWSWTYLWKQGLLWACEIHLTKWGRRLFANKLSRLIWKALN